MSEQIYCIYYRSTMNSTPVSLEFSLHHDHSFIISEKYLIQLCRIENRTIWVKLFSLRTSIRIFFKFTETFIVMYFWQFLKTELNEMSKYAVSRGKDLKCNALNLESVETKSGVQPIWLLDSRIQNPRLSWIPLCGVIM